MGLLVVVLVTAADVIDAKAAPEVFARLDGQPMSRMGRRYADSEYHNYAQSRWGKDEAHGQQVIVRRPEGHEGWVTLPIRWTVERTFAWLGKGRRLSKDRERRVRSSEAFMKLAMIQLMLNRFKPRGADPELKYQSIKGRH